MRRAHVLVFGARVAYATRANASVAMHIAHTQTKLTGVLMSHANYAQEINKTGFILEHKVTEILRKSGWSVISNKYYEDDFGDHFPELDL